MVGTPPKVSGKNETPAVRPVFSVKEGEKKVRRISRNQKDKRTDSKRVAAFSPREKGGWSRSRLTGKGRRKKKKLAKRNTRLQTLADQLTEKSVHGKEEKPSKRNEVKTG